MTTLRPGDKSTGRKKSVDSETFVLHLTDCLLCSRARQTNQIHDP